LTFGKLSKLLPVDRVMETDKVLAFKHPKPYWGGAYFDCA